MTDQPSLDRGISLDEKGNYILLKYTEENFIWSLKHSKEDLLLRESNKVFHDRTIRNSPLIKYFIKYFEYKSVANSSFVYKAKNILIEKKFVSESFLNDIKNFYSDCFSDYNKYCIRIHFFGLYGSNDQLEKENDFEFSCEDFENLILGNCKEDRFINSYLGHITVKPTGNSIVGPTFLKPYPTVSNKRIREYNSIIPITFNLFGRDFPLEGLVFQEQDQTIGLCATQAVWFSVMAISNIFRTDTLFPADISILAGFNKKGGRVFPNTGLSNVQIFSVYQSLGLSTATYQLKNLNRKSLEKTIYSYNKMGIPILLGYKPYISREKREKTELESPLKQLESNRHMVTVLGYRIDEKENNLNAKGTLPVFSNRLKRFFGHDDQEGPYQKIEVVNDSNISEDRSYILKIDFEEKSKSEYVELTTLIIPLKSSIRILLEHVEASVMSFDYFHRDFLKYTKDAHRYKRYEWDIYLEKAVNYKKDIVKNQEKYDCSEDLVKRIAYTSFPKYIWVARLYTYNRSGKSYLYDIIYDASESPSTNNFCIYKIFFHSSEYGIQISNLISNDGFKKMMHNLASLNKRIRFTEQHIEMFNKMVKE